MSKSDEYATHTPEQWLERRLKERGQRICPRCGRLPDGAVPATFRPKRLALSFADQDERTPQCGTCGATLGRVGL